MLDATHPSAESIAAAVRAALAEDVGSGDLSAGLVPSNASGAAVVRSREEAVLCGTAWFDEVYRQLDAGVSVRWWYRDGATLARDTEVCAVSGPWRALLTGERTALNFLQTLSGTATTTRRYAARLVGSGTRLLDTRKTVPGLRLAQKYAVRCGGGHNHRLGLYDAVLIKENHLAALGSIAAAVAAARRTCPGRPIEVEVERLDQLEEAIAAGVDRVMLDNFGLDDIRAAVALNAGRVPLEVSGSVDEARLDALAATGIDFVSCGALTKHVHAIDYSMRYRDVLGTGAASPMVTPTQ